MLTICTQSDPVVYNTKMVKYKTIERFALESGYSETTIRLKIENGVWSDGVHIKAPDGLILISVEGYNEWVESGVVTPSKRASQSPTPVSTGSEPKLVKPKEARETTRPEATTIYKENRSKLIRMKQVRELTTLSPATIYRKMAEGKFPAQVRLTEKTSAWVKQEVIDFVKAKMAERDSRGS